MADRLCLFCKHFEAQAPDHGYYPGEYESGYLGCAKGVWRLNNDVDTPEEYRRKMAMARTCAQFSKVDG